MGFTYVRVQVCNAADPERRQELELLVDTGATLSVIPRPVLQALGIAPTSRRRFRAFDGRAAEREIGIVMLRYGGWEAGASVIFGEPADVPILGVAALETLGFEVDPVSKQLRPVEMLQL